jgi:hypothetical protein
MYTYKRKGLASPFKKEGPVEFREFLTGSKSLPTGSLKKKKKDKKWDSRIAHLKFIKDCIAILSRRTLQAPLDNTYKAEITSSKRDLFRGGCHGRSWRYSI